MFRFDDILFIRRLSFAARLFFIVNPAHTQKMIFGNAFECHDLRSSTNRFVYFTWNVCKQKPCAWACIDVNWCVRYRLATAPSSVLCIRSLSLPLFWSHLPNAKEDDIELFSAYPLQWTQHNPSNRRWKQSNIRFTNLQFYPRQTPLPNLLVDLLSHCDNIERTKHTQEHGEESTNKYCSFFST